MAGRPKQFTERTVVSHTVAWRKRADRLARKLKITRAELVRQAVDAMPVGSAKRVE